MKFTLSAVVNQQLIKFQWAFWDRWQLQSSRRWWKRLPPARSPSVLCTASPAPPCESAFNLTHADGGLNVKRLTAAALACRVFTAECLTPDVLTEIKLSVWHFLFSDLGARKHQLRLTIRPTSLLLRSWSNRQLPKKMLPCVPIHR